MRDKMQNCAKKTAKIFATSENQQVEKPGSKNRKGDETKERRTRERKEGRKKLKHRDATIIGG